MGVDKACPVVLREAACGKELLVFEHPLAGFQLVKGTVEPGESPDMAALRELYEEAGISGATCVRALGVWSSDYDNQVWSFWQCEPRTPLPESWNHYASDDGGHLFRFFWHPLHGAVSERWHPVFQRALRFVQAAA